MKVIKTARPLLRCRGRIHLSKSGEQGIGQMPWTAEPPARNPSECAIKAMRQLCARAILVPSGLLAETSGTSESGMNRSRSWMARPRHSSLGDFGASPAISLVPAIQGLPRIRIGPDSIQ